MPDMSIGERLTDWGEVALFAVVDTVTCTIPEVRNDPVVRRVIACSVGAVALGVSGFLVHRSGLLPFDAGKTHCNHVING
jgi:hypothetical protein